MLVIVAGEQILSPSQVCQTCLWADRSGQPRWQNGQLRCGNAQPRPNPQHLNQYDCPMGFRIVSIED
jgi:hypothetical protein